MTDPDHKSRPLLTAAHLPLIVLGALLIMASVLGVTSGIVGPQMLHRPVPGPSDPITIP